MIEDFFGLIIACPPLLAIYAIIMRSRTKKQGQGGFVYNGEFWVAWIASIAVLGGLFLTFGLPLLMPDDYAPDWDKINIILLVIIEYICYVLIAYRPATAEEIEEAKASGKSVIKVTTSATTSVFSHILSCLGLFMASIPTLLSKAFSPVLATKVIHGVTYKLVGTGFSSIIGSFIGNLILFVIFTSVLLLLASTLAVLIGIYLISLLAIATFVMNIIWSKQTQ